MMMMSSSSTHVEHFFFFLRRDAWFFFLGKFFWEAEKSWARAVMSFPGSRSKKKKIAPPLLSPRVCMKYGEVKDGDNFFLLLLLEGCFASQMRQKRVLDGSAKKKNYLPRMLAIFCSK